MNKETFLKQLEKNLKYLNSDLRKTELANYENLINYDLDPIKEANSIYEKYGLNFKINKKTKFLDSIAIIINTLESKNNKKITNVFLFFLYLLFLLIVIKIPFIYIRDMISNIFNTIFSNDANYIIWNLLIELFYAIATIIIFIKLINKKAQELEKDAN